MRIRMLGGVGAAGRDARGYPIYRTTPRDHVSLCLMFKSNNSRRAVSIVNDVQMEIKFGVRGIAPNASRSQRNTR